MLVVILLDKFKKYLTWSYRTLGFFQTAGKFVFIFLLMILFNLYELAYYVPTIDELSRTQTYLNTYWFNLGLMAASALFLTLFICLIRSLFNRKNGVNLVNMLETRFPEFRTRLSTAYDNSQNINIVTKKLLEDVHSQLTAVKVRKIVPRNQIFKSLFMFLLVSGVVIFCIYEGFSFNISPNQLIDNLRDNIHNMNARASYEDEDVAPDFKYKIEAAIIKNGEQVEMEINPSMGLGFTNQVDIDTKQNFNESMGHFNDNFEYSQTYSENLPEEYEPLIKQYFEELSSS